MADSQVIYGTDSEVIYGQCLKKAEVNFAMRECAEEHYLNLKNHLNKVWQALITEHNNAVNEMDEEDSLYKDELLSSFQDLQEAQKKWEEYEEIACRFAETSRDTTYAGECGQRVIKQRIEMLLYALCPGYSEHELCKYREEDRNRY